MLIGHNRCSVCVGRFVCDEPDFRLINDDMGRVCGTDGTHVSSFWSSSVLQGSVHAFLRDSVNVALTLPEPDRSDGRRANVSLNREGGRADMRETSSFLTMFVSDGPSTLQGPNRNAADGLA
jgi:hypothetical protein